MASTSVVAMKDTELSGLLTHKSGFVYINSISLAYRADLEVSRNLKSLIVRNVRRNDSWLKLFSLSFYRDKLHHSEDPFESALGSRANEYWKQVPCQLFVGTTSTPQFVYLVLFKYSLGPYLRGIDHLYERFCMEEMTYVFDIQQISRC